MKKMFLTSGLLVVLTAPAMAETKWFVGANVGYADAVFSDELDDQIDEDIWKDKSGTISMALNGGMRFGGHDKIYNGGIGATLAYMPGIGNLSDGVANPYYMTADMDFTALYVSYDNYIRLSGDAVCRTDFMFSLGLGHGWVKESLKVRELGQASMDDHGLITVLKIGFGGETIYGGLGWNVMANIIVPNADDDADFQGSFGIDFGLRYTF